MRARCSPRVLCVPAEVGYVNCHVITGDEPLELRAVEEAQPTGWDDGVHPLQDGLALAGDLLVESVVGDEVHVPATSSVG